MLIVSKHYREADALPILTEALENILGAEPSAPVFYCIGTERHLLDSFGPLTGTMIKEHLPHALVFGSLDDPLHAKNLPPRIFEAKKKYPDRLEFAIDASLGSPDEIGMIKIRQGSLLPGKAVAHRLPPVGHYSITGVVGTYRERAGGLTRESAGLANIYHLSRLVSAAIVECCRIKTNREE